MKTLDDLMYTTGRPIERDRIEIMRNLLAWSELPDSMNLNSFCTSYVPKIAPSALLRMSKECVEFNLAYEIAKANLAARREEANSAKILGDAPYKCNHTVYDKFALEDYEYKKKFESSLKVQEMGTERNTNIHLKTDEKLRAGIDIPTKNIPGSSDQESE